MGMNRGLALVEGPATAVSAWFEQFYREEVTRQ